METSLQRGLPISLFLPANGKKIPNQIILYLLLIQPSRASVVFLSHYSIWATPSAASHRIYNES